MKQIQLKLNQTMITQLEKYIGIAVTFFTFDEFGLPIQYHGTLEEVGLKAYSQVQKRVQLKFRLRVSNDFKVITIHSFTSLIIWEGWHHLDVRTFMDEKIQNEKLTIKKSFSCFSPKYVDMALNSVKVKPIFLQQKKQA